MCSREREGRAKGVKICLEGDLGRASVVSGWRGRKEREADSVSKGRGGWPVLICCGEGGVSGCVWAEGAQSLGLREEGKI